MEFYRLSTDRRAKRLFASVNIRTMLTPIGWCALLIVSFRNIKAVPTNTKFKSSFAIGRSGVHFRTDDVGKKRFRARKNPFCVVA